MTKSNLQRSKYIASVNKAIDYIRDHLSEKILLEDIANEVDISPFHFHRIFSSFIGETVHGYIRRTRLEKAANLLVSNPSYSITDIAFQVGFGSSQTFSRAFNDYFDESPSSFRKKNDRWSKIGNEDSKFSLNNSNKQQDSTFQIDYADENGRPHIIYKSEIMNAKVEVKKLPETTIAYIRHIGPYEGDAELFGRLFGEISKWAGPRNLINQDSLMFSVYHEDPEITEDSKTMVDVCISVPADTKVDGEIGKTTLPAGEYAIAQFTIKDPKEYAKAWEAVYTDWLPESGYQPDNRPCFEMYRMDSMAKDKKDYLHKVEICVPVKAG